MNHVKMGCLSRIPPGGGTNKNRRFHQHMKTFFHRSKVGVFLAYALLSVIIYHHNSQHKTKHKVVLRPIEASEFTYEPKLPQDVLGIVPEKRTCSTEDEQWEIALSDKEIDMKLTVQLPSRNWLF